MSNFFGGSGGGSSSSDAGWVGRLAGQFYGWDIINSTNTGAVAADTLYAIPYMVFKAESPVDESIEITVTGTSTGVYLGIYAAGSDGLPGSLVIDGGTAATGTIGVKTVAFGTPPSLTPGLHYLVALFNGTATVRTAVMNNRSNRLGQTALSANPFVAFTGAVAYGALPSTFGSATGSNTAAQIAIALRY